jgi:hypothetical protein
VIVDSGLLLWRRLWVLSVFRSLLDGIALLFHLYGERGLYVYFSGLIQANYPWWLH